MKWVTYRLAQETAVIDADFIMEYLRELLVSSGGSSLWGKGNHRALQEPYESYGFHVSMSVYAILWM